jgi:hypothetical protein
MIPNMRVLTLNSFGETPEEDFRVTLSAMNIKMVAAQDGMIQNRPVKVTTVLFIGDSECVTLNLSDFDLNQLENCVGAYGYIEG